MARIAENLFGIFKVRLSKKILPNNKKISKELNTSSLEKLLTICHGDAKPDNFMFRKIEIDLEEMECEGLEGILIDWQGGFIGDLILEIDGNKIEKFSILEIWNNLLDNKNLYGYESHKEFYHLTNLEVFKKLKDL